VARLRSTSAASVPALVASKRYLAAMVDALLEHLLRELGVLRDPILGGSRLGKVAQQRRHILDGLTRDFDLALGDGLHAFDCKLVRLA